MSIILETLEIMGTGIIIIRGTLMGGFLTIILVAPTYHILMPMNQQTSGNLLVKIVRNK